MSTESIDKELFELCKEVVTRTSWQTKEVFESNSIDFYEIGKAKLYNIPRYTSDYLLDRLPQRMGNVSSSQLNVRHNTSGWSASYSQFFTERADTPLKALLNLVIALDDSKELSHE